MQISLWHYYSVTDDLTLNFVCMHLNLNSLGWFLSPCTSLLRPLRIALLGFEVTKLINLLYVHVQYHMNVIYSLEGRHTDTHTITHTCHLSRQKQFYETRCTIEWHAPTLQWVNHDHSVKTMDKLVTVLFLIALLVASHSVIANRRPIRSVLAPAGK